MPIIYLLLCLSSIIQQYIKIIIAYITSQNRSTDLIKNQYGSDVYELVQLYSKLNEAGKNKIMEELRDTAALPKYTEPVKRDAQKMA